MQLRLQQRLLLQLRQRQDQPLVRQAHQEVRQRQRLQLDQLLALRVPQRLLRLLLPLRQQPLPRQDQLAGQQRGQPLQLANCQL